MIRRNKLRLYGRLC